MSAWSVIGCTGRRRRASASAGTRCGWLSVAGRRHGRPRRWSGTRTRWASGSPSFASTRSEERRVGKEGRSRGGPGPLKKKRKKKGEGRTATGEQATERGTAKG